MLTELEEEWSKGTDENIPATRHGEVIEVWRDRKKREQEYQGSVTPDLFGSKNRTSESTKAQSGAFAKILRI